LGRNEAKFFSETVESRIAGLSGRESLKEINKFGCGDKIASGEVF
jgi:hypothetical protein